MATINPFGCGRHSVPWPASRTQFWSARRTLLWTAWRTLPVLLALPLFTGCGPTYRQLRHQGQQALLDGAYGPARMFFVQADQRKPRQVDNLHDLGACSVMLARERLAQMNHAAAMRELDDAIAYYDRAIDTHPGFQAAIEGKSVALKLKGEMDKALEHAEWAARTVGPSARQFLFLARELEERGDTDAALLRYRQAVAVEPRNPEPHRAMAQFLLTHGNEPAAVAHLRIAYRLDPSDRWVMEQLARRSALPVLAPEQSAKP